MLTLFGFHLECFIDEYQCMHGLEQFILFLDKCGVRCTEEKKTQLFVLYKNDIFIKHGCILLS